MKNQKRIFHQGIGGFWNVYQIDGQLLTGAAGKIPIPPIGGRSAAILDRPLFYAGVQRTLISPNGACECYSGSSIIKP
ncbi:MAG: hypothetical protein MI747_01040 [Desulfobacterales bacterium]|nr:hypothetical protein [Desulfobacterales bacterium]